MAQDFYSELRGFMLDAARHPSRYHLFKGELNRHPDKPLACTGKFDDRALNGTFGAVVLTGDCPEAFNDIDHAYRVVPEHKGLTFHAGVVELPAHSLTIVKVPAGGWVELP